MSVTYYERNKRMAEKLMGWTFQADGYVANKNGVIHYYDWWFDMRLRTEEYTGSVMPVGKWKPATYMNQTMRCVEKMNDLGFNFWMDRNSALRETIYGLSLFQRDTKRTFKKTAIRHVLQMNMPN